MPGHVVDADHAEQQPETRHQQRARQRGRRHVGEEDQAEHEQRGVFRRAEAQRESASGGAISVSMITPNVPAIHEPDSGDAQRCAGTAPSWPWRSRRCKS